MITAEEEEKKSGAEHHLILKTLKRWWLDMDIRWMILCHKSQCIMNHVTRLQNSNNNNKYWKRNAVICFNIRVIVLLVVAELNALKIPFSIIMIASGNNVREEIIEKKTTTTTYTQTAHWKLSWQYTIHTGDNKKYDVLTCEWSVRRQRSNGMLLNRIWLKHK